MFPFLMGTMLGGLSLLETGGGVGLKLWTNPCNIPKWCKNGPWLVNWLEVTSATHMHITMRKNVSVFAGNKFGFLQVLKKICIWELASPPCHIAAHHYGIHGGREAEAKWRT